MFGLGQRVRCVEASWFTPEGEPSLYPATLDAVYTIAGMRRYTLPNGKPGTMLAFAETPDIGVLTPEYDSDGFRPISDGSAEFERLREVCLARPSALKVRDLAGKLA